MAQAPSSPWPTSEPPFAALRLKLWQRAALFGVGFLLLAAAGPLLSSEHGVFIHFWLPGGLYLAALLLIPTREWPPMVAAAFIANLLFNLVDGANPLLATAWSGANAIQALTGAWLIRRFVSVRPTLVTLREFWGLLLFGAVLSPALGALIGATTLVASGMADTFLSAWANWWTFNTMAILMFTPFVLVWLSRPDKERDFLRSPRRVLELVLLMVATSLAVYYVLIDKGGIMSPYKVLLLPFLLYAGLRLDRRGATAQSLLVPLLTILISDHVTSVLKPGQLASGEVSFILKCNLVLIPLIALLPSIVLEERERTLVRLRKSEEIFRTFFESVTTGVALVGFDGKFQRVNRALCDILGYDRAELERMHFNDVTHPDDHHIGREFLGSISRGHATEMRVEKRYLHKQGRTIWAELICTVAEQPESGGRCLVSCVRDITERKASEESLKLFRALLDHADDLVEVIDPKTARYLDVSEKALIEHGYTREEYLARTVFNLDPHIAAGGLTAWETTVDETKRQGSLVFETQHRRKDGSLFDVEVSASYVRLERDYVLAVVRDITERRAMAAQLRQAQKMEAIGQLAGGVAHDFNNILAVIMMQADVTAETEEIPLSVQEGLQQIRAASERAANLTRQLLLFSRKQTLQRTSLDLNEVVTNLTRMLQRFIREDVRLALQLHPTPLYTLADPGMLDQILLNLAVNARDAMPEGGRLLIETSATIVDEAQAALYPDAKPGRHVCLTVSDTGAGIPSDVLPHIFEPFFTTKDPGHGTGLGLATVFGIVKQHHGFLTVETTPGHGTRFQICLPASEKGLPFHTAPLPTKPHRGTETLLLVEDQNELRSLTRTILERHGYTVHDCAHSHDALQLWEKHNTAVSLLLTDLVMPSDLSGHELARRLTEAKPGLKVIFMSGYSAEFAGRQMELKPGENFLQKPFSPDHLLETIRRSLDS